MELSLVCRSFQYGGGMERYQMDLIRGFYEIGMKPNIYASKFDTNLPEYQFIHPIHINLKYIPKLFRNNFLSYISNKNKQNTEITITTTYTASDVIICGGNHKGYLKALNKPASLMDSIKIKNEVNCLKQAKLVIAHSEMMKNELISLYEINPEKITTIYPPVNIQRFNTITWGNRQLLRKKFGFKENEIIYLFPSTGHSRKGFDILKQYFSLSDLPIRLVIAGTPIKEEKNITSLGYCKNMEALYHSADFTIMASNYEPFGLTGIESILSGTPLIFAENIGCLEVLKNNFGFTFDRLDPYSLNIAIRKSIERFKQHESARIDSPNQCLKYNPELSAHISKLLEAINLTFRAK